MKRQHWVMIGLLVFGWVIFLGQPTTVSRKLRSLFAQFGTPFVKLGDLIPSVRWGRAVEKQNRDLTEENNTLRQQVRALSETARENLRLRQLLNITDHAGFRTVGARVIGRDASNWWKTIQIDRGTRWGLQPEMAVLTANGLVGKTISATAGESRVLLLFDPSCKVSALLQDSREHGIISGSDAAFTREPRLRMTFVRRESVVHPGQAVITSGLGGVFPKGILIGAVAHSQIDEQTGMYQVIDIKPAVDFQRLEEVVVILETRPEVN